MNIKNLLLFTVGVTLSVATFLAIQLLDTSIVYAFTIIGIALGGVILFKRSNKLDTALGILLIIIAVGMLGLSSLTYASRYSPSDVYSSKNITATIGQRVITGGWAVTVLKIDTPEYVKNKDSYYRIASYSSKTVVVWLRIENLRNEIRSLDNWHFKLITDSGRGYERTTFRGEYIWNVTEDIMSKAVEVQHLYLSAKLSKEEVIGCIYFVIPRDEKPEKLLIKIFYPDYGTKHNIWITIQ